MKKYKNSAATDPSLHNFAENEKGRGVSGLARLLTDLKRNPLASVKEIDKELEVPKLSANCQMVSCGTFNYNGLLSREGG